MHAGTFHKGLLHPKHWLVWIGLGLVCLFTYIPASIRRNLMAPIGRRAVFSSKGRLRAVKSNINICFPELSREEKQAFLLRHAEHAGFAISEMAWIWFRSLKRIKQRTRIEGLEHLHAARETGRPVIFLVPHMLWLEYGIFALGQEVPMAGIFNTFKNPVVDWLVGRKRAEISDAPIRRQSWGSIRQIVKHAKNNIVIYHLIDEDLGKEHSVFAPYFGTEKASIANTSFVIEKTQALVVPMGIRYEQSEDKFVVSLAEAEDWTALTDDPVAVATAANKAYEMMVRPSAEEYMWNLRLFRNRPDGDEREFYSGDIDWD